MAKVHHYDLGDAVLRINENETDGYLLTLVQLDNPMGVVKLLETQTHKLIDCLMQWAGVVPTVATEANVEQLRTDTVALTNEVLALREQLEAAKADNDLAQQEIARLADAKPKRGRPKKEAADAPPTDWDSVPAEPVTDQGAQADDLPGFAVGDLVEVIATTARAKVDRVFRDNPRKVQVLLGGSVPKVFDVADLRLVVEPAAQELDVPELVETLEAVGFTVHTEVPGDEFSQQLEEAWAQPDPVKLRQALYEDAKSFGFTPDEMRDLIAQVTGLKVSTRELDVDQLQAVLQALHERSRSKLPF